MAQRTLYTWILLLIFTITVGVISNSSIDFIVIVILMLSAAKFIGVAFEFMNLKAAHGFWKITLTVFLTVFIGIIWMIRSF